MHKDVHLFSLVYTYVCKHEYTLKFLRQWIS